jgi:hypothetical protein
MAGVRVREPWATLAGLGLPCLVALAGLAHGVHHAVTRHQVDAWQTVALVASPLVVGAVLVLAAVRLCRRRSPASRATLGLWTFGGWLHVGAIVVILFLGQEASGAVIVDPWVTVNLTAMGGALLGLFVGGPHNSLVFFGKLNDTAGVQSFAES